ncbi:Undecaprenyl-phosphate 4-deoxy-4-formamido-L-arabinose transferase [subsurface metagenome]
MSKKNNNSNFISVIVPVYNEEKNIRSLIERLLDLNFPRNKYEVIVVDNNSKDNTSEIIKEFQVIYLCETKQSSYAARNKGIKESKGNILAFIDGDCIPDKDWLKNAITRFINEDIDIIAGNIILSINYSIPLKLIYIYQLIAMDERQKDSEKEGKCAGGNLIVKKEIFEKIGYFDERLISGGDGEWTKRATNNGFTLRYCNDVKVYHPLEKFGSLLKRAIRIGYGKSQIRYLLHNSSISSFLEDDKNKNILSWVLRIYCNYIKMFWNNRKKNTLSLGKLLSLSFLSILLTSASFYGFAKGFIYFKLNRKFK